MNSFRIFSKTNGALAASIVVLLAAACNKQPVGPTGPDPFNTLNYTNVAAVRALYNGAPAAVPANSKKLRAIVVSNYKNEAAGNFRIQDESGRGVALFLGTSFTDTAKLRLGSQLDININGGTVTTFNGDIQIGGLDATAFSRVDSNKAPTPRITTVREAIDSIQNWASTVVELQNVSISQGTSNTTGVNYNITDASGTMVTFVRNTSGLNPIPLGNAQSVTGYLSIF
ncbi:MAG: hypothetical protein EOO15_12430, partial [Chitinophagaceae bacterium]